MRSGNRDTEFGHRFDQRQHRNVVRGKFERPALTAFAFRGVTDQPVMQPAAQGLGPHIEGVQHIVETKRHELFLHPNKA
jgi:hypothetical protein